MWRPRRGKINTESNFIELWCSTWTVSSMSLYLIFDKNLKFSRPIFIDLAVDGPAFGIPGSVGALMVERPADPVEGWDDF